MQLVHSAIKSKYSANCREKKLILAYLVSSHYLYCTILQFLEHCVYISDQKVKFLQNNAAAQLWQLFLRNTTMYILKFVFYEQKI